MLQVDGDARVFLMQHVMALDQERMKKLGRPMHCVGLRMFLPPVVLRPKKPTGTGKKKGKQAEAKVIDWQVDVKAESLIENPSKLFLEALAEWSGPQKWDKSAPEQIVSRLDLVSEYVKNNFLPFLRSAPEGDE
jgi:hypothetical protein